MGTVINVFTVLIGSTIGFLLQKSFSRELKELMLQGIGLVTVLVGVQMGLKTENILIPLFGLLLGGIIGFLMRLDYWLDQFGHSLAHRFASGENNSRFVQGFVTASLIFCAGPMTILGSLNDGLSGDYHLLVLKSTLDGFTSLALTASLGAGVFFSIFTIIIVQGSFTLLAFYLRPFFSPDVITETAAVGGLIIIGLGIVILELRKMKIANFLPAIFVVPLLVKLIHLFTK